MSQSVNSLITIEPDVPIEVNIDKELKEDEPDLGLHKKSYKNRI